MLIPRQPKILYLWLEQNGYDEETSQLSEDLFAIYIWEKDDQQTATEIMSIVVR